MADSTLDDFFAKKDKSKKGKSKTKYTTTEAIAKKLEEGGKKTDILPRKEIREKNSNSSSNQSISTLTTEQEDDEWKNIEEKETDYSGLRIQALSISEKEKEEEQLKEQMLSEQNGELSRHLDGQSGPWKVMQVPVTEEVEEKPTQEPPPTKVEEAAPKTTGTYRPPAMRNATSSTTTSSSSSRRHPRNAPQLSSDVHFPTLSSAIENNFKISENDLSFQSVKHGARSKTETQKEVQLDLENQFSALRE